MRLYLLLLFFIKCCFLFAQQQQIDSLQKILPLVEKTQQVNIHYKLAQLYAVQKPAQAIMHAENAFDNCIDEIQKITIGQQLAQLYHKTGNINKSIAINQQLISLAEKNNQPKATASAQTALASSYFNAGNLSESLNYYLLALRYYEQHNEKAAQVSIYNGLTNIYTKQNNFSKALEFNLKAINIYEASSDKMRALIAYDQVGTLYLRKGDFVKANTFFNKSLNVYIELNNQAGVASSKLQLGLASLQNNQPETALNYYKQSEQLARSLSMLPVEVAALNGMAKCYLALKQYDKCIETAKKSSVLCKKNNLNIELEEAYEILAIAYKLSSNLSKASTFDVLSKEIKDSLYNDSTLKQLADLQLRYEDEKKQQQIELKNQENKLLEIELISKKKIQQITFWLLAITVVALFIVGILFYQIKKKEKRLLQQKHELQQTNLAIAKQREELLQLNNVKDRFFSIISHDLRNSLTTMKLYFKMVSNKNYQPPENSGEITNQISLSVDNTIDLLENLLIWAQSQIKNNQPVPTEITLVELVEESIQLLQANAAQKNITLHNQVHAEAAIWADLEMIKLVIRNLISNAIKFTGNQGLVTIQSSIENNFVLISITDTGVGISTEALNDLFNKSKNPSTLGTANEKGTGLGLLLCKEFTEKNGGTIAVNSVLNKGTTFILSFPAYVA